MREDENEMLDEWKQVEIFVEDNMKSRAVYIIDGLLEAVHLQ